MSPLLSPDLTSVIASLVTPSTTHANRSRPRVAARRPGPCRRSGGRRFQRTPGLDDNLDLAGLDLVHWHFTANLPVVRWLTPGLGGSKGTANRGQGQNHDASASDRMAASPGVGIDWTAQVRRPVTVSSDKKRRCGRGGRGKTLSCRTSACSEPLALHRHGRRGGAGAEQAGRDPERITPHRGTSHSIHPAARWRASYQGTRHPCPPHSTRIHDPERGQGRGRAPDQAKAGR